jgi:hypothetical protein
MNLGCVMELTNKLTKQWTYLCLFKHQDFQKKNQFCWKVLRFRPFVLLLGVAWMIK